MAVGSVETSWTLLSDTGQSPVRFLELKEMVPSWRGPGTQAETVVLLPAPANPRGGNVVGGIAPPR